MGQNLNRRFEPVALAAAQPKKRIPAGENPEKRRQIMDGARRVFSTLGFDAASVNDIAREARVSKGTLYVYFENKEQLFTALIFEERARHQADLFAALESGPDVARALATFGERLARLLTTERIVRAQRVVVSMAERMPDLTRAFYHEGPEATARRLATYLEEQAREGRLIVPDPMLAAAQFIDLSQTLLSRARLFGAAAPGASETEIARTVNGAVAMFMAAYGPKKN